MRSTWLAWPKRSVLRVRRWPPLPCPSIYLRVYTLFEGSRVQESRRDLINPYAASVQAHRCMITPSAHGFKMHRKCCMHADWDTGCRTGRDTPSKGFQNPEKDCHAGGEVW